LSLLGPKHGLFLKGFAGPKIKKKGHMRPAGWQSVCLVYKRCAYL